MTRLLQYLSSSHVLRYLKEDFKHDFFSGVVVGLVALPLAIAFAIASGAGAEQGVITVIVAGGIMALSSGSSFQISGPSAIFIVLIFGIIHQYGFDGLLVAGFMAGVFMIMGGILRLGAVIKYIPYPVSVGLTAGAGLLIFINQLKHLLGLSMPLTPDGFLETVWFTVEGLFQGIHTPALIVGGSTLCAFYCWKKLAPQFPATPVAFVTGIIVNLFLSEPALTLSSLSFGFPQLQTLNLSIQNLSRVLPAAFAITLIGSIESILSAMVADGMTGKKHNSNRELISQGLGNIIAPFLGGIPATGGVSRTVTNIQHGARTRMSGLLHALVGLGLALAFWPMIRFIPYATLAALLMLAAYNMSDIPHFVKLFKAPKEDVIVLLTTFFFTVFVDLVYGVIVGVMLASLLFIKKISEINIYTIEDNVKLGTEGSRKLHAAAKKYSDIMLFEVAGPLFFGAASIMLDRLPVNQGKVLILRMKHVHVIDSTALHALELIIDDVHQRGGKVILSTVQAEVLKILEQHGLVEKIGGADFVASTSTGAIEKAKFFLGHNDDR